MESGAGEERDGSGAIWFKGCSVVSWGEPGGERHDRENILNLGQVGQRKDIGGGGVSGHNIL